MMQGAYKKFDKESYKEFDARAKQAAIKILKDNGILAIDNTNDKDPYAIDLILFQEVNGKEEMRGYCEVLVIAKWLDGAYPYDPVTIVERKIKQLRQYKNFNTYIFLLNKDCTRGIWGKFKDIAPYCAEEKLVKLPNCKVEKDELAAPIPLNLFQLLVMT